MRSFNNPRKKQQHHERNGHHNHNHHRYSHRPPSLLPHRPPSPDNTAKETTLDTPDIVAASTSQLPVLEITLPPPHTIPTPLELRKYILENHSQTINLNLVTTDNILYYYHLLSSLQGYDEPYDLLEHALSSPDPWNCNPSKPLPLPPVKFESLGGQEDDDEMTTNRPSKAVTIIDPETGEPSFQMKVSQKQERPESAPIGRASGRPAPQTVLTNHLRDRRESNPSIASVIAAAARSTSTIIHQQTEDVPPSAPSRHHQRTESGANPSLRHVSSGSGGSGSSSTGNVMSAGSNRLRKQQSLGEDAHHWDTSTGDSRSMSANSGLISPPMDMSAQIHQQQTQQQPQQHLDLNGLVGAGVQNFLPAFGFARLAGPPVFSPNYVSPPSLPNMMQGLANSGGPDNNSAVMGGGFGQQQPHHLTGLGMFGAAGFGGGGSDGNPHGFPAGGGAGDGSMNNTPMFPNVQFGGNESILMQILFTVNRLGGVATQTLQHVNVLAERFSNLEDRIQILEGTCDSVNTSFTLLQSTQDKLEGRSAQNEEQQRKILQLLNEANRNIGQLSNQAERLGKNQVTLGKGFGALHSEIQSDFKLLKEDVACLHSKVDVVVRNNFTLGKALSMIEMRQYNAQSSVDELRRDLLGPLGKDIEHFESGAQRRRRIVSTAEFLNSDPVTGKLHGSMLVNSEAGDSINGKDDDDHSSGETTNTVITNGAKGNYPADHHYDEDTIGLMMDLAFRHGSIGDEYAEYEDHSSDGSFPSTPRGIRLQLPIRMDDQPPAKFIDFEAAAAAAATATCLSSSPGNDNDDAKTITPGSTRTVTPVPVKDEQVQAPATAKVQGPQDENVYPATTTAATVITSIGSVTVPTSSGHSVDVVLKPVRGSGRNSRQGSVRSRKNTVRPGLERL